MSEFMIQQWERDGSVMVWVWFLLQDLDEWQNHEFCSLPENSEGNIQILVYVQQQQVHLWMKVFKVA